MDVAKDTKEKIGGLADKIKEVKSDVKENAREVATRAKEHSGKAVDKIKKVSDEVEENVKERADKGKGGLEGAYHETGGAAKNLNITKEQYKDVGKRIHQIQFLGLVGYFLIKIPYSRIFQ